MSTNYNQNYHYNQFSKYIHINFLLKLAFNSINTQFVLG